FPRRSASRITSPASLTSSNSGAGFPSSTTAGSYRLIVGQTCCTVGRLTDVPQGEPVTARRGLFWVGLERAESPYGTVSRGPMYVQWEAPVEEQRPWPFVLVHGGGGQGTDYLITADGRPGWATALLEEGFRVYVVDRPGHGRAAFHPDVLGA